MAGTVREKAEKYLTLKELCAQAGLKPFVLPPPSPPPPPEPKPERKRNSIYPKKIKLWRHIRCGWIGSRCQMVQVMSNRNSGCPRCRTQHGIMSPEILSRGFEHI